MKRIALSIALGTLLAAVPFAAAYAQAAYSKGLTLGMANKCLAAAEAEAKKNNWHQAFAVVDDGGHLLAFARMDNTQIASARIAIDKATAANNYRRPTKAFEDALVGGRMAILGLPGGFPSEGGILLMLDGKIIGAVGASGGTAQQDGMAAKACADTIGR